MTALALSTRRERMGGAAAALALSAALGTLLIWGLAVRERPTGSEEAIALFEVAPDRPKQKTQTRRMPQRNTRPSGAAAPPNLRSRATEVAAPVPIVPVRVEPVLTVAEKPADAAQATSGAAPVAGPGTGAGGVGDGFGGGGEGDGDGAGDRDATPPRLIRGDIYDSDFPAELMEAGRSARVTVVYLVGIDGRVSDCEIDRSSGSRNVDAFVCRLIRQRYRFRPSRDGRGQAVPAWVRDNYEWVFERLPPED
jgi:protein TonB